MSVTPFRRPAPRASRYTPIITDSYLTDGRRLLRVVSRLGEGPEDAYAAVEDCLTLEISPYSADELAAMGLRRVQARA